MIKSHKFYLDLAFKLAEKNLGKTKLNPSVGCVVVKNGSVISSGVTSINGRPHAEFNALNKKINFAGSTLYSTLEPCVHKGLTAPCTQIIKKKKIKKVVFCFNDPDIRTFRKSKLDLNLKNIKCNQVYCNNYKDFYESYYFNKIKNKLYLSGKIALSKDYYSISKKKRWITNLKSRRFAHLLRSQYDAVVSTSKTINKDNSLLNCRLNGMNNNKPDLIIIDLKLKLKKKLKLIKLIKNRKTYLITSISNNQKLIKYKELGFKIIHIKYLKQKKDIEALLDKIYKLGYGRVLLECGLIFLNTLIHSKLLNNLYIFQTNYRLGTHGLNNDTPKYVKMMKLKKSLYLNLDKDKIYNLKLK